MRYKTLCKMRGQTATLRLDHIFRSSGELVRYLDKQEGINADTTDYIYIHEHRDDGTVVETYAYERDKEQSKECDVIEGTCSVPDTTPATSKVANGMFEVREAG